MTPRNPSELTDAPLSYAQEGIWLAERMFAAPGQFVVVRAYRLRGHLDPAILDHAIASVCARHDSLLTSFVVVDGVPRQRVCAETTISLERVDLRDEPEPLRTASRIAEEMSTRSFDLSAGPPLRALLLKIAEDEHVLVLSAHHIAIDLWSWPVVLKDLIEFYSAEREGRPPAFADEPMRPAEFARWQRQRVDEPEVREQLEHMRGELADVSATVSLPLDKRRGGVPGRGAGVLRSAMSAEMGTRLAALSKKEGATITMIALAAFAALLGRYNRERVVTIGLPVAGDRRRPEVEKSVGLYINVLPAKVDLTGDPTFRKLVRRARAAVFDVIINQEIPYELLVRELGPERAAGIRPYQQVSLNVHYPDGPDALALDGVEITEFSVERWSPAADLSLTLDVRDDKVDMLWIYDSHLFQHATIAEFAEQFKAMLEDGVAHPERPVGDLDAWPRHRRATLPATPEHSPEGTICDRFEYWVQRDPEALAVGHRGRKLTYRELDRQASALALALRGLGVRQETVVGVCLDRSPELVVAYLAILKAGGAYLPLDTQHPETRRMQMVRQAGAAVVITGDQAQTAGWLAGIQALDVAVTGNDAPTGPTARKQPGQTLAYVMFTSGSTGTPKGVSVTHKGVLGLVVEPNYVRVSPTDRVAQVASVSSDITTFEIWAPLLNGASVHIVDRETLLSPAALGEFLAAEKITTVSVTSVLVNHRAYTGPLSRSGLRDLQFGAEPGSPDAIRELLDSGFCGTAAHVYGPTETTMLATCATISDVPGDCARLPVGYPISATEAYVMDVRLRPVPPGMPGELCVAGDRLARGYIGRPGLTAERFCPNPIPGREGERMYRTGDLARQRPDGQFEILGRLDRQLKIRGFRVEPAEVEAVLTALPEVAEAAAVARRDPGSGEARLVAYLSPMPGSSISVPAVRALLREQLPEYMVPSAVVELPRLPLTATGKVDARALPPPQETVPVRVGLDASLGPRERLVAEAMCSVLGVGSMDRGDNFFAAGGHSLLAVQLLAELRSAGFEVPMAHLLANPTVAGIAGWAEHDAAGLPALILVHGGGGGVAAYAPLLTELADRCRCVLLEARAVRHWPAADLAAHYVEQVYPTLTGGTAVLAGWSLGGTIAHEMACLWRDSSGTLLPVMMIDSWPGAPPASGYDPLTAFVYDLASSSGASMPTLPSSGAEPAEALAAALSQLRDVPGFARLEVSQLADRFAIFQDLSGSVAGHQPRHYEGSVTLAEAARSQPKAARWADFCSDLTTVVLPGDHHSVLRDAASGIAALSAGLMRQAGPVGPTT